MSSNTTTNTSQSSCWALSNCGETNSTLQLRLRLLRLIPNSSRDAIQGLTETPDGAAIKARVRAIPENGKANKALITTVSKWLSLPKSNISLSAGTKSRTKILSILVANYDLDGVISQLNNLTDH